jgi:hypothetical protein
MTRRAPGFYAFRRRTPGEGLHQLVWDAGRLRADGELFRFPSAADRDAWVADALDKPRMTCRSKVLPPGWRAEDALEVTPVVVEKPVPEDLEEDGVTWDDAGGEE